MHATSVQAERTRVRSTAATRQAGEAESGGHDRLGSQSLLQAAVRAGASVPRQAIAPSMPRSAELVENLEDGRYFLRAHHQGRYWWRQVPRPSQPIPADADAWHLDDGTLSRQYWLNYGEFRLRKGAYHRVASARETTRLPP